MSQVTLKGNAVNTFGSLPKVGSYAPEFTLVKQDLSEVRLNDFKGKQIVLNIFPSIDTPVCAMSVRKFNKDIAEKENTVVLCVSADLPFAAGRFCGAENIENVDTASTFRNPEFGKDYGVVFVDGPLKGLLSRAVVVIDADGKVIYNQQVPEITEEPDYKLALKAIG